MEYFFCLPCHQFKLFGLCAEKAETQNIRIWSKEMFTDQEGANREDGSPGGTSSSFLKSTGFWLLLCQGEKGDAALSNCSPQNSSSY